MKTTYFILRVHDKISNSSITKLYKTKCYFVEEMFERAVEHYKIIELYWLDNDSINEKYEFYYNYFTIPEIVKI